MAKVAVDAQGNVTHELVDNQWVPVQKAPEVSQSPSINPQDVLRQFQGRTEAGFGPAQQAVTGAAASIPAGLAGLVQSLNPFASEGAGADTVRSVQDLLTPTPSQATIKGLQGLAPIAEGFQKVEQAAGDVGYDIAGPVGGAIGKTLPTAALMLTGTKPVRDVAKAAGRAGTDIAKGIFKYQSPTKQRIAQLLSEGSTEVSTAKFQLKGPQAKADQLSLGAPEGVQAGQAIPPVVESKISQFFKTGAPKVEKSRPAIEAIKQGFDEGVIATVKGSSPADKRLMARMVSVMEKGQKDARFSMTNRPSDVAGDSLMNRFKVVSKVNKRAGDNLDRIAKTLKGKSVNAQKPVNDFMGELDNLGVSVVDDPATGPMLNFIGSDIEGSTGAINLLNKVFDRLKSSKAPDAYDIHRLKKFIDEQVSYGKTAEGLTGKTAGIVKGFRRSLDSELDSAFPKYNKVNTEYSTTREVIDSLQDVAGKKLDLTGPNAEKAVGTLMRRLMSNAQSRVKLLDSVNNLESVAVKHGGKFNDDLLTQVLFVDELESVFGTSARTSLAGETAKGFKQAGETLLGQKTAAGMTLEAGAAGVEKLRGINQAGALKAIKNLLKEGK